MQIVKKTSLTSEQEQAKIIQGRILELFDLIQTRLIATDTEESGGMTTVGLGMIQMLLMMTEAEKLRQLLTSFTEILLVVGKWDLPPEHYQAQIEPLIIPLLESL